MCFYFLGGSLIQQILIFSFGSLDASTPSLKIHKYNVVTANPPIKSYINTRFHLWRRLLFILFIFVGGSLIQQILIFSFGSLAACRNPMYLCIYVYMYMKSSIYINIRFRLWRGLLFVSILGGSLIQQIRIFFDSFINQFIWIYDSISDTDYPFLFVFLYLLYPTTYTTTFMF